MKVGVYNGVCTHFFWIVFTINFNQMSISRKLKELEENKLKYMNDLEDLHISEPPEKWYKQRRYELESQIAMIESVIDDLEYQQRMMRPFFWTTVAFVIAAAGLVIWRFTF